MVVGVGDVAAIDGVEQVAIGDGNICCGSDMIIRIMATATEIQKLISSVDLACTSDYISDRRAMFIIPLLNMILLFAFLLVLMITTCFSLDLSMSNPVHVDPDLCANSTLRTVQSCINGPQAVFLAVAVVRTTYIDSLLAFWNDANFL